MKGKFQSLQGTVKILSICGLILEMYTVALSVLALISSNYADGEIEKDLHASAVFLLTFASMLMPLNAVLILVMHNELLVKIWLLLDIVVQLAANILLIGVMVKLDKVTKPAVTVALLSSLYRLGLWYFTLKYYQECQQAETNARCRRLMNSINQPQIYQKKVKHHVVMIFPAEYIVESSKYNKTKTKSKTNGDQQQTTTDNADNSIPKAAATNPTA